MSDYQLVDLTVDDSQALATGIESRIGVDTEFMRERTFFAELCLMQISTPDNVYCADPLGEHGNGKAREEFWTAITQPEWVLHAGRQDLEVIYQTSGKMPTSIFDTQIAAAFLGLQPQIGSSRSAPCCENTATSPSSTSRGGPKGMQVEWHSGFRGSRGGAPQGRSWQGI